MKVACKQCGKKFKGVHGVAVHAHKMHAEVFQERTRFPREEAPENRPGLVGAVKSFRMSLDHMKAEFDFMEGVLERIQDALGQ